jgi:hypothetical protein
MIIGQRIKLYTHGKIRTLKLTNVKNFYYEEVYSEYNHHTKVLFWIMKDNGKFRRFLPGVDVSVIIYIFGITTDMLLDEQDFSIIRNMSKLDIEQARVGYNLSLNYS